MVVFLIPLLNSPQLLLLATNNASISSGKAVRSSSKPCQPSIFVALTTFVKATNSTLSITACDLYSWILFYMWPRWLFFILLLNSPQPLLLATNNAAIGSDKTVRASGKPCQPSIFVALPTFAKATKPSLSLHVTFIVEFCFTCDHDGCFSHPLTGWYEPSPALLK